MKEKIKFMICEECQPKNFSCLLPGHRNTEALGEWMMKCGEAALMDVDEGVFSGAAMAALLTHNAQASPLDNDRLMMMMMIVNQQLSCWRLVADPECAAEQRVP
jgi:hypothetical protein